MGLLFGMGYRKGMNLAQLIERNPGFAFDAETMSTARTGMELAFNEASYEFGKKLSMTEIDRNGGDIGVFAYGEAEIDSFAWVLNHAHPQPGEVFYDLGSGLGKAVIAAFLLNNFSKLVGIELLSDLASAADTLLERYNTEVHPQLPQDSAAAKQSTDAMSLIEGDFLELDWSDADVVYANATRFDQPLMEAISKKAEKMKPGSRFVITTTPLLSNKFSMQKRGKSAVSWMGNTPQTFFVFVRNDIE